MNPHLEDLVAIATIPDLRTRYRRLEQTLTLAANEFVGDAGISFSGLFSKTDYLLKQHKSRLNDRTLPLALNDARIRMRQMELIPDKELADAFTTDLKAVARFIALVAGEPVPEALERLFPLHTERHYRQRMRDEAGHKLAVVRGVIESWDDTYIICTREDTGETMRVAYAHQDKFSMGDWTYLNQCLIVGETLGVVRPREEDGVVYPELLVFAPDYLVNATTVAACFAAGVASPYVSLLDKLKPAASSEAILLGNFASQLLDEVVRGQSPSYADSVREFFRHNALAFAACPSVGDAFHTQAQRQRKNIERSVGHTYKEKVKRDFSGQEAILEPSFFSDTLGLQGRMDFLNLDYRVVMEQKSGKGAFVPGCPNDVLAGAQPPHLVQILLYRALLHYDYRQLDYTEMFSFLLYSKYADGLYDVTSMPQLLFEAMRVRNQIAFLELHYARHGMRLLERLTPEHIFPGAHGKLWTDYQRPQTEALLQPIHQATPLARAYYFRMMRFVAKEHVMAKMGNRMKDNSGFAAVWTSSIQQKREAGSIYEALTLHFQTEPGGHITRVRLHFAKKVDVDTSNFRKGDIVFFYPYRPDTIPDATATMVFRGTVTLLAEWGTEVELRSPQTSRVVFDYHRDCLWAMEHDFMEASYTALYRGLHAFLSTTPRRRNFLLCQREPEVDTRLTLRGNYAEGKNKEFNDIVLHAKQARDFFLIIGPPGTGKTSYGMRNVLEEYLREPGASVLLLSYTNRAVDEMCSKMMEMEVDGLPVDFIRMGHAHGCDKKYHDHLFDHRAAQCHNVGEVRRMVEQTRVFCGTTTSLSSAIQLFQLKHFSVAIVDEASQILEPHIMPLLCAMHGEQEAIDKFVFIGDEKQLPAVAQQSEEDSVVTEKELVEIGLINCRLSLFERLLHYFGYKNGKPDPAVCHLLTRQGRMHELIADFPNKAFYGGALRVVPLPHQKEATPAKGEGRDALQDLLLTHRILFVDCAPKGDPEEPDNVNQVEAEAVAAFVGAGYARTGSDHFDRMMSVGVIVPYRNQISTVRSAVDKLGVADLHDIAIDTVERYQGSQRDLIIYGFTAKRPYQLDFLAANTYVDPVDGATVDRKLNVAMTRARRNLVLVGHADLLSRNTVFRRLIDYCRASGAMVSWP